MENKMKIVFCLVAFIFSLAHSQQEATLSCSRDDAAAGGVHGPPGRHGLMGIRGVKGEQGAKGIRGKPHRRKKEINKLTERVNDLQKNMNALKRNLERRTTASSGEPWKRGSEDGICPVVVNGKSIDVYCEYDSSGKWLVFQRRFSGEEDFYVPWNKYKTGFGNMSGEFWLGLDKLHDITNSGSYKLRVELVDWDGTTAYGEYREFFIKDSSSNYRLHVRHYSGTAGDSLTYHDQSPFSTRDRDNDQNSVNCADHYRGGWWFKSCHFAHLNGEYFIGGYDPGPWEYSSWKGIIWEKWRGSLYSMKKTKMKLQLV